jgi:hypothetical protein
MKRSDMGKHSELPLSREWLPFIYLHVDQMLYMNNEDNDEEKFT